jgi:hypothetical protein
MTRRPKMSGFVPMLLAGTALTACSGQDQRGEQSEGAAGTPSNSAEAPSPPDPFDGEASNAMENSASELGVDILHDPHGSPVGAGPPEPPIGPPPPPPPPRGR